MVSAGVEKEMGFISMAPPPQTKTLIVTRQGRFSPLKFVIMSSSEICGAYGGVLVLPCL